MEEKKLRTKDRADWLHRMLEIAEPVIVNLAENQLKEKMPKEFQCMQRISWREDLIL